MRLADIDSGLHLREPLSYLLDIKNLLVESRPILSQLVGLTLEPRSRTLDRRQFLAFQANFLMHVRQACGILMRLGYVELPLDEFEHFVVLCLLNSLAADLSVAVLRDVSDASQNTDVLRRLKWA